MSLISRLNDSLGLTSIIVTHHVHETLPVADRAIVIANGKIVFSGTPSELEATGDPLVLQFLRGEPDGPIAFATAERERAAWVPCASQIGSASCRERVGQYG